MHKRVKAMFTLYQIGFCSLSKVALVQCEQVLMFCFGADVVPKNSLSVLQFAMILFDLKRSFAKRGSIAISGPIKVFKLDSDPFQNLSDVPHSTAEQSSSVLEQ